MRGKKRWLQGGVAAALLVAYSLFGEPLDIGAQPDVLLEGPYAVVRVVDGDTLVVDREGADTKVRMIGVNTPESVHRDQTKNTPEGVVASKFTKGLLERKRVYLEYDVAREDKYGRDLAYVYLEDQKTMVNRLLIEEGYALIMTIQPNSKYSKEFHALQVQARENKKGFWETGFFADAPKKK